MISRKVLTNMGPCHLLQSSTSQVMSNKTLRFQSLWPLGDILGLESGYLT